ncbi:DNA-binding transcriptional regulator, MarR family [Arboricoccus pini]|uniref:DNA-binding transcriptional regulator, MarR family n=1 Tax=Arboricoccus pini TaxID=1963835 RepID=A0A212QWD2_9PROT|nr:MarR family transcriptional regulator [Arboricoccus pini]SNB64022.1 DNA-binding transcriptional regulator, MarR family [Arboricoccus pini]
MHEISDPRPVPAAGEGKRGEDGHLGYLLRQAAGVLRLRLDRAMADLEVTLPQFAVLTMLANYPGLSNADLARLALLTPQTVSVIVANLARRGTITRRPHSIHGRIQHIDLTDEGRDVLARCRQHVRTIEQDITRDISAGDEAVIRRWLVSIASREQATGA